MATATRNNKKAMNIAFSILGVPANLKDKQSPFQKKIDVEINKSNKYGYSSK